MKIQLITIALNIVIVLIAIGYQFAKTRALIDKMVEWCINLLKVLITPKLLFTFGIGWLITNGWSYIAFALGVKYHITWLATIGGGWLAILWFPGTPEKIITVAIAIWLAKIFFPNDKILQEKLNKLRLKEMRKNGK